MSRTEENARRVSFNQAHACLRRANERFAALDQQQAEPLRRCRIITGDVFDDPLQVILAAGGENYPPVHERTAWRSALAV